MDLAPELSDGQQVAFSAGIVVVIFDNSQLRLEGYGTFRGWFNFRDNPELSAGS